MIPDCKFENLEMTPFNEKFDNATIKEVLTRLKELDLNLDESAWFDQMKEIGASLRFAPNGKLLKKEPENYIGSIGDVAEMLRITLTARKNAPNPYYVMKILGKEECLRRFDKVISTL